MVCSISMRCPAAVNWTSELHGDMSVAFGIKVRQNKTLVVRQCGSCAGNERDGSRSVIDRANVLFYGSVQTSRTDLCTHASCEFNAVKTNHSLSVTYSCTVIIEFSVLQCTAPSMAMRHPMAVHRAIDISPAGSDCYGCESAPAAAQVTRGCRPVNMLSLYGFLRHA